MENKYMIVQYSKDDPELSQQELASYFTTLWAILLQDVQLLRYID
jgi:hypothetical protein